MQGEISEEGFNLVGEKVNRCAIAFETERAEDEQAQRRSRLC